MHGEELAGGHLLEGGSMEDKIRARDRSPAGFQFAYVADEEFDLVGYIRVLGLVLVTHVVLLLFVAGEDADFFNIGAEESLQDSVSETSSASTNE